MTAWLAIIKNELWRRRWSLLWWSIGVAAMISIDMLLYLSIKGQAAQYNQLVDGLPPAVKALVTDAGNITSPAGYLSARIYYLLLPLLLSIFSIGLGAGLIAREEESGTLELLLARPVSRTKLLLAKVAAGATALGLLTLVAIITALICLPIVGFHGITVHGIAVVTLNVALMSGVFGAIALALTCLSRFGRAASLGIASLVAFGGYLIASLESLASWLRWPSKLFPYHYFHPSEILQGTAGTRWQLLGYTLAIIILVALGWWAFRRRDIATKA